MTDNEHDAAAAFRILTLPLADLLDKLVQKDWLSIDEACECLESRLSGEVLGPLSRLATAELEKLEDALRRKQDLPRR